MRHHPRGKLVLEKLGGKQYIMKHMANKEHATVRYEALIAVQKLMTQNWGTLGQQLKVSTAECGGGGVGTGDIGTVLHTEEKDAQSVFFILFSNSPTAPPLPPPHFPFPFHFLVIIPSLCRVVIWLCCSSPALAASKLTLVPKKCAFCPCPSVCLRFFKISINRFEYLYWFILIHFLFLALSSILLNRNQCNQASKHNRGKCTAGMERG